MNTATAGRWLLVAGGIAIAATVAVAWSVIGPPSAQRAAKLDARRVDDLVALVAVVERHAGEAGRLPAGLEALVETAGPAPALQDPAGRPYRYEALGERRFRICAQFDTDSADRVRRADPWRGEEWRHPAGAHCFERTIARTAAAAAEG